MFCIFGKIIDWIFGENELKGMEWPTTTPDPLIHEDSDDIGYTKY